MANHNHDLNDGDTLTDTRRGESVTVNQVHANGDVTIDGETFTEQEVCAALRDSVLTRDGEGPELVNSF